MNIHIPDDSILLSTQKGGLLVSASHGLYCAVQGDELSVLNTAIENKQYLLDDASVPSALIERLKQHGFDGGPRPYKHEGHLIQFQVTNACNLHCIYCAVESGRARPQELTLEMVKQTIDEAVEIFPDVHVSFTGGEPLLVPWVFDALEYACQKTEVQVGLLSNLLLLKNNEHLFQRVVSFLRAGHQVRMSMSAVERAACNRLSGKDCYDDALEVIHLFEKEGVFPELDIPLSAPDMPANVEAFSEFRRSLPKGFKYSFCTMYYGGREKGKHIFSNHDEKENALDDLSFEGGVSLAAPESEPVTHRRKGCVCTTDEQIFVRSDGAVFPCFRLVGQIGHISEGLRTIVERRRQTPLPMDLEPCRSCPFVQLCAGGCFADRWLYQQAYKEPVCGPWRKKLIAEMLYEDKPYVLEWDILLLLAEARKRGLH